MSAQARPDALYEQPEVADLLRRLQEATRATPTSGFETYVPPAGGEIAEANYHHFIFGQRGSGKSSLLRHLQAKERSEGRAAVWIDQEIFSNLAYPDVLVSAVYELIAGVVGALEGRFPSPPSGPWWKRPFIGRPQSPQASLIAELHTLRSELEKLKFAPLGRKVEWTVEDENSSKATGTAATKLRIVSASAEGEKGARSATTAKEVVEGSKEQYLERMLPVFRSALVRASSALNGGFVFIDDLYQLLRDSQPLVLAYLHRLVKDTGFWLKIGSIRYSTVPFRPGNPPRGMQIGHDAQEVALDRGLRNFRPTQAFLEEILSSISKPTGVDVQGLFTDDSRKRLVLAAGGVARDYLRLASQSITEAKNRGVTSKTGSHRVTVEDVNKAAGSIQPGKLADMRADDPAEADALEGLVRRLTEFCRSRKKAFFLTATNDSTLSRQVNALQHLRFAHALYESETVPDRRSQRFNGWLLDVAELSASRATVGMDFMGWQDREARRNRRLIFTDSPGDCVVLGQSGETHAETLFPMSAGEPPDV
jgi:hypothetical protein